MQAFQGGTVEMIQGDLQRQGLMLSSTSATRYISYFSGLLSGSIRMNSSPLFLHYVLVPVLPAFEPGTGESTWEVVTGVLSLTPSILHPSCTFFLPQASSPSLRSISPCSSSTHLESSECCVPRPPLPGVLFLQPPQTPGPPAPATVPEN